MSEENSREKLKFDYGSGGNANTTHFHTIIWLLQEIKEEFQKLNKREKI